MIIVLHFHYKTVMPHLHAIAMYIEQCTENLNIHILIIVFFQNLTL